LLGCLTGLSNDTNINGGVELNFA